jgi:hypothetical protein
LGSRSKKSGNKSSIGQRFNKTQIDIIKFFKDFNINILKHKTIYGVMVSGMEDGVYESDEVKLIGFVSVPLVHLNQDDIIEDKLAGIQYSIIGDTTCLVDKNFNLSKLEDEYCINDKCAILDFLQEAVDEGLCQFSKDFDVLYVEPIAFSEFEEVSNDINER